MFEFFFSSLTATIFESCGNGEIRFVSVIMKLASHEVSNTFHQLYVRMTVHL